MTESLTPSLPVEEEGVELMSTSPDTSIDVGLNPEELILREIVRTRKELYELAKLKEKRKQADAGKVGIVSLTAGSLAMQGLKDEDIDYKVPPHCIPIRADVQTYDWNALAQAAQFDVILMDPPWQLASANPTRGVAIGYKQLADQFIEELPIPALQREGGLLFIWIINVKYAKTLAMIRKWGYTFVDDIAWVKRTVNRRLAKGHGYYLQHAKETCLVAMKGSPAYDTEAVIPDIIYSERRGQSQKPEEMYELIERLVPNGRYLEIFGRKNNLRNYWVTVGNEL